MVLAMQQPEAKRKTDRSSHPPTPHQRLISRDQASQITGIPSRSIYALIINGALPVVRFPDSRKLWIERCDLESLIQKSKEVMA